MVTSLRRYWQSPAIRRGVLVGAVACVCFVMFPWAWYRLMTFRYEIFADHYLQHFIEHVEHTTQPVLSLWQAPDRLPLATWRQEPGVLAVVIEESVRREAIDATPRTPDEHMVHDWLRRLEPTAQRMEDRLPDGRRRIGWRGRMASVGFLLDRAAVVKSLLPPHPPWLIVIALALGCGGLSGWLAMPTSPPRTDTPPVPPQAWTELFTRLADVMPTPVLLFTPTLQLWLANRSAQQQLGIEPRELPHVVDLAAQWARGDVLLRVLDRLHLNHVHSEYADGIIVVRLALPDQIVGYWVMDTRAPA